MSFTTPSFTDLLWDSGKKAWLTRQDSYNRRAAVILQLLIGRTTQLPNLRNCDVLAQGTTAHSAQYRKFWAAQGPVSYCITSLQNVSIWLWAREMLGWCNTHLLVLSHSIMVVTGWVTQEKYLFSNEIKANYSWVASFIYKATQIWNYWRLLPAARKKCLKTRSPQNTMLTCRAGNIKCMFTDFWKNPTNIVHIADWFSSPDITLLPAG